VDRISGYIYCDLGRFDEARKAFLASYEYSRQGDPTGQNIVSAHNAWRLGWVDLKQGRLEDARARLAEIKSLFPPSSEREDPDDLTLRYQLLEAEVALAEDSPEKAVAVAEKVRLKNFAGAGTVEMNTYNTPFCKDVLARAYWKKGDLDAAAAEYRKLMTIDPSNQVRLMIHPLYHYRLGRVLEEKGDKAGAAVEYRKFLEYWKDADKTHPELAEAKKLLAGLDGNTR
jgi:tetratricopeptide (TPR) repeat protein